MEKRYNPQQVEAEIQAFWDQNRIYRFEPGSEKPVYSIDTPPPTVSGSLHIGHIFSYAQAEMIARYKRMQGYNVFYPFGFDDNGLPTERLVEQECGIKAKDLDRGAFQQKCMETAERYEQAFIALWKALGFSADWTLQYRTVSPETQRISQRSFLDLVKMGRAYEKTSPVLWCCACQTSIAQAELDTKEADTLFHTIRFTTENGQVLPVATTRPELLHGCVCLFVHPEDARYTGLPGMSACVPLYSHTVPILTDEGVDREKGTGIVMCATFGDSADAAWVEQHGLPHRSVILPDGTIADEVPYLGGMNVFKARKEVVRLLEEQGLLMHSHRISHTVGIHERCGTAVEIIPSRQWYIDILTEKQRFLEAAEEINWYPGHMKKRYLTWVENLKWDWCISRQRYFGVPIPVWYCAACGKAHFPQEEALPVNPMEADYAGRCACGCAAFVPETGVMDTWATSSLTPLINLDQAEEGRRPELFPMSMRTQAHEIIRTWTFYTIVKSLYHTGRVPWRDIMICGYVLAKKGEKISKSKGNAQLSPEQLLKIHSADALRYWAANARLGTDTFFDADELALSKRFLTKLWNAARFSLSHLQDCDPAATPELLPVDRWILARGAQCAQAYAKLLDAYEIGLARHAVDEFFWTDFCDYYLEIVKERLYQPEKHGGSRRLAGQYALYHTLLRILMLYAPFVPHITEQIYQEYFREHEGAVSLHRLVFAQPGTHDDAAIRFGEHLKGIMAGVRKEKSRQGLSIKAELPVLEIRCPEELRSLYEQSEADLMACTNALGIAYVI